MPFLATVVRVLIASPGDVSAERGVIERAIIDWDDEHARDRNIVFLPVRWERASPRGGASGQDVVNEDLVDTSDVLVGVFWWRIGTATREDRSGSIEEIRRFARSEKPYGLFFKAGSMPMNHDPEQYAALGRFKQEVRGFQSDIRGLTKDFRTRDQLRQFVGRFLTDTARRISPSDQVERLEQTESMARVASIHANIDRHAGGELDRAFFRQDMSRKACLVLGRLGPIQSGEQNKIQMDVINEGDFEAREVKAWWDFGDGFKPEPDQVAFDVIPPARSNPRQRFPVGLRIPEPERDANGNAIRGQEKVVRLRLTFRDGLGKRDQATFTIRLHNNKDNGYMWTPVEDKSAAKLSALCQFTRPEAQ